VNFCQKYRLMWRAIPETYCLSRVFAVYGISSIVNRTATCSMWTSWIQLLIKMISIFARQIQGAIDVVSVRCGILKIQSVGIISAKHDCCCCAWRPPYDRRGSCRSSFAYSECVSQYRMDHRRHIRLQLFTRTCDTKCVLSSVSCITAWQIRDVHPWLSSDSACSKR